MADFSIRQGGTLPIMTATLSDANGPINLTTAISVFLHVRKVSSGATLLNAACAIVSAAAGTVSYAWQAADTLTPGDYEMEFKVTWVNGAVTYIPNEDPLLDLKITAHIA